MSLLFQILKVCIFKKKPSLISPSSPVTAPTPFNSDAGNPKLWQIVQQTPVDRIQGPINLDGKSFTYLLSASSN